VGVDKAAELGLEYIEPMVHFGRELMSEAGYFHTVSMFDDPYRSAGAEKGRRQVVGPAGPGRLGRPEVHGEYLKGWPIRHAASAVAGVNTDEGSSQGGRRWKKITC